MNLALLKQKLGAFAAHCCISLTIVVLAGIVIHSFWYPSVLFRLDGGLQGLKILAFVEVVLGPLLTFFVFDLKKKRLKQDLLIIGIIQILCFISGLYIIYHERPLSITLAGDTFYTANAVSYDFYGQSPSFLKEFEGEYPKMLFTKPIAHQDTSPLDRIKRAPDRLTHKYLSPIGRHLDEVMKQGLSDVQLEKKLGRNSLKITEIWNKNNKSHPNARFYRLITKLNTLYCLYDPDTNTILDTIELVDLE